MSHRRTYETDSIRVYWDSARCIHTGRCLQALPEVFDVQRRPWVDVQATDADAIADAVERCPTGALRYERLDGAKPERPERPTVVVPIEDGPLLMMGDLDVRGADGEPITQETRLTLCRCGMSRISPSATTRTCGVSGRPARAPIRRTSCRLLRQTQAASRRR